jgi:hypothetical protein
MLKQIVLGILELVAIATFVAAILAWAMAAVAPAHAGTTCTSTRVGDYVVTQCY